MNNKNLFYFLIFIACISLVPAAEARDLVEAASSAQSMFNRIGVAAISIGITIGGILYAVGFAMLGRTILFSGFIGACAILGGPALIALIGRIFGAAV